MIENSLSLNERKEEKANILGKMKIKKIQEKLSNDKYIYDAVYCLASIITDKILSGGGIIEDV